MPRKVGFKNVENNIPHPHIVSDTTLWHHWHMKRKHQKTLQLIFKHPVSANIQWKDVLSLLEGLGADVTEREGSRILIVLRDKEMVQHRPHPSPSMDKGAVASMREFLVMCGCRP